MGEVSSLHVVVPPAQPQTESPADVDQPHSVQDPRPPPQHEVLPVHVIEGTCTCDWL